MTLIMNISNCANISNYVNIFLIFNKFQSRNFNYSHFFDLQRSYILPNSFAPTKITPSIWQYPQPIPPKTFGSIVQNFQISFSSNLDQIQTPWSKRNLYWTKNCQTLPDSLLCINTSPQKFSKIPKIPRALWHFIIHLMCMV